MKTIKKYTPKVNKLTLLLLASIVWCFAGSNILNIGIRDMSANWIFPLLNIMIALLIFGIFFHFIFLKMSKKHVKRIKGYEQEKICAFAFFDAKGYTIMACMITFGIVLRNLHLIPPMYLGTFYTGLGCSLLLAGICFLIAFLSEKNLIKTKRK